jgi:GT2 family glycosyltransferase
MKLSVVIVNYNVKYFLEQALVSVYKAIPTLEQVYGPDAAEVWVVDNFSPDGSAEMVAKRFPKVKLIANQKNTGFSYANNQALRQSKAEYQLLLNPDTVVEENTFLEVVRFMDEHPDAGGLGVKMIDGKGHFLPESKRGLPTPAVAFYKIFGLAKLFPRSRRFGKYHLGFLNSEQTHEVDVLAGAFMLLRRNALEKVGYLDEEFFMYGEDIDLSYRITKGGYKNYYFPGTQIIHYKGESTKKSSINYVFVFYKAMVIFARKHLSRSSAAMFAFLINIAIYLRAFLAVIARIVKRLSLPLVDYSVLYIGMFFLVRYWERTIKYIEGGKYPETLTTVFLPVYILTWILGLFLMGGYRRPYLDKKIISGVFTGTLIISVMYAFIDDKYRYSRAIIILGAVLAIIVFTLNRVLLALLNGEPLIPKDINKNILIAGSKQEADRVYSLLEKAHLRYNNIGVLNPNGHDNPTDYIGHLNQVEQSLSVYKVDELIFCARDISFYTIISWMTKLRDRKVTFKIVPDNSVFIIGSNSKDEPGDYYSYDDIMAIEKADNRLNKRALDIISALLLVCTLPLNIWFIKNPSGYLKNIFMVLSGRQSWVGYIHNGDASFRRPKLRTGVLTPQDGVNLSPLDPVTRLRLDYLYAKDYNIYKDISIILNGFSKLGQQKQH